MKQELEIGSIDPDRYDSYLHLNKEIAYLEERKASKNSRSRRLKDKKFKKHTKNAMSKKQKISDFLNHI